MRHTYLALPIVAALAASTTLAQSPKSGVHPPSERPITQLIIKYKGESAQTFTALSGASKLAVSARRNDRPLIYKRPMSGLTHVVELSQPMQRAEALAVAMRLKMDPNVEYAEPDDWVQPYFTPNDQYFFALWHYASPLSAAGGANFPAAWDISRGQGVIVAVVDTGVVNHPDLSANMIAGYDFITSTISANDGDGRDADASDPGDWRTALDCPGIATARPTSSWHGTHVSGTVAAVTDNTIGVSGTAHEARILPIRALGKCGGTVSDIADAIVWAASLPVPGAPLNSNRADVINLSLGSTNLCGDTYQNAINSVLAEGVVVVAATGNDGASSIGRPANCTGVIAVTAHTHQGDNASYANVGPGTTISAPGGGPCASADTGGFVCSTPNSTTGGNNYPVWSTDIYGATTPTSTNSLNQSGPAYLGNVGTSMAAPHVSGVAALLISRMPTLTSSEVAFLITDSARPHPATLYCATAPTGTCGSGLLDARAALDRLSDRTPLVTVTPTPAVITGGQQSVLTANATPRNSGSGTFTYSWTQTSGPTVTLSNASTATPSFAGTNPGGTHTFAVTVRDGNGYSVTQTANVRSNNAPAFASAPSASVVPGGNLVFNVTAGDPESDVVTYVATNLPAGSAFAAGTGQFTWNNVPTTLGTHTFDVVATDGSLNSASTTVTINIANPPPPPPPSQDSGGGGGGSVRWLELLFAFSLLTLGSAWNRQARR
jgi:serine protease